MRQSEVYGGLIASRDTTWWRGTYRFSVRCVCRSLRYLGIVAAFSVGEERTARHPVLLAQTLERLTVRPHEMVIGTRTEHAGEYQLDSLNNNVFVYVPEQAVGTRRVPLVVFLHGGGITSRMEIDLQSRLADKYGMILLAPDNTDAATVDAALKHVLTKFAIDPDQIALAGGSSGGRATLELGPGNLDIFSRLAPLSPAVELQPYYTGAEPRSNTAQLFVSAGIGEPSAYLHNLLAIAQYERQAGHVVQPVLNLRPHRRRFQDNEYMWRWLQESWAMPSSAEHATARSTIIDSLAPLTPEVLSRMTAFWADLVNGPDSMSTARFVEDPDWSRTTLPENQKQITMPALREQERVTVFDMVDMPKLAAKHPSIAAALAKAGLTPQQEEAYRTAFISAWATEVSESVAAAVVPTSVLGQNVAFIRTHKDEVKALETMMTGVPRCEDTIQAQFGC